MIRYIVKRLLMLIPILLFVTFIVFSIMSFTPGTPGRMILGSQATQEQVDQLNEELGYNKPFLERYFNYIIDAVQGNFGNSYNSGRPVFDEIFQRFPTTLKLAILGVVSSALIGIPLGILSAVKQYSIIDGISTTVSLLLASIPGFWLGLMLIIVFSQDLGWLPSYGLGDWKNFVMPTIMMALPGAAGLLRLTRSAMLETIRQDYIRTARAKGAGEKRVIWIHALKNALLPVITALGIRFGSMLGGTVLVETVFSLPGLGAFIILSIRQKDVPQVMAAIIFLALMFCLILLAVDLIYAFIDPRIKAKYTK